MELDELIDLVRAAWPKRYQRGLVTHVHQNNLDLADGSQIHLRVLIQTLRPENCSTAINPVVDRVLNGPYPATLLACGCDPTTNQPCDTHRADYEAAIR